MPLPMVSCWLRQRVLIGVIMAAGYCVGIGAVEMPDSATAGNRGGDATRADAALAVTGMHRADTANVLYPHAESALL